MGGVIVAVFLLRGAYALLARVHKEEELMALAIRVMDFGIVPRGKVKGEIGPSVWSFAGRAGRIEWVFAVLLASLICGLLDSISKYGVLLGLPWALAAIAVTSRRLHDFGLPGWFQAINIVFTALFIFQGRPEFASDFWLFSRKFGEDGVALLNQAASALLAISYMVLALLPGDRYSNCYGEVATTGRRLF